MVVHTECEYMLLRSYVGWCCLRGLSAKVQMLSGTSEVTLHHQDLAVYGVLGGRLHVVEVSKCSRVLVGVVTGVET